MDDNPNTTEPGRPSRWFQFRLLTLLIVVTVAAMFCSLGVRYVRAWQQQREGEQRIAEALKRISKSGCRGVVSLSPDAALCPEKSDRDRIGHHLTFHRLPGDEFH